MSVLPNTRRTARIEAVVEAPIGLIILAIVLMTIAIAATVIAGF
jgi:hypothetical protein